LKIGFNLNWTNNRQYKDQPKGNRINEDAWIYKEGANCYLTSSKAHGYIIYGFSVQNYQKKAF